ncbi:hypothetical protein BDZ91DRAFT_128801 [Kalaharituber pfeilii]|nr:hypothetical protein BDZ91DRAFT_128801 [Kalaharituber pfeilii]
MYFLIEQHCFSVLDNYRSTHRTIFPPISFFFILFFILFLFYFIFFFWPFHVLFMCGQ